VCVSFNLFTNLLYTRSTDLGQHILTDELQNFDRRTHVVLSVYVPPKSLIS